MIDPSLHSAQIAHLTEYLQNERGLTATQVSGSLFSSGVLDSLELIRLVAFVESTFQVRIPLSEASLSNFDTVHSISELVTRLVK